jgi:hypothetical protein
VPQNCQTWLALSQSRDRFTHFRQNCMMPTPPIIHNQTISHNRISHFCSHSFLCRSGWEKWREKKCQQKKDSGTKHTRLAFKHSFPFPFQAKVRFSLSSLIPMAPTTSKQSGRHCIGEWMDAQCQLTQCNANSLLLALDDFRRFEPNSCSLLFLFA